MQKRIKVIQYGIGPIALKLTQYLAERPSLEIVGAVDIDPSKIGKDIGELAGLVEPIGISVSDASEVLHDVEADVVALTTSSKLDEVLPSILEIIESGKNIVSSCEELTFPWLTKPEISKQIDAKAREKGVSVLSTGVNPGFIMDFLPLVLSGVCRNVESIRIERIQDARYRRLPFQKKIGAGLTIQEFEEKVKRGVLRHVGLLESVHMLAAGLGWKLDRIEDALSPVIAQTRIAADNLTIEPGQAAGVSQIERGYIGSREILSLIFRATVGEPEPRDRIVISGAPDINVTIAGGINGDIATCAVLANAVKVIKEAEPGLRTMADIRPISCTNRGR